MNFLKLSEQIISMIGDECESTSTNLSGGSSNLVSALSNSLSVKLPSRFKASRLYPSYAFDTYALYS